MFLGNDAGVVFDVGGRSDPAAELDQVVTAADLVEVAAFFSSSATVRISTGCERSKSLMMAR